MLDGVELIRAERQHQIEKHTAEHDDEVHANGDLAKVAAVLLAYGFGGSVVGVDLELTSGDKDGWGIIDKCNGEEVRILVVAGALIAAEIDRILRQREKDPFNDLWTEFHALWGDVRDEKYHKDKWLNFQARLRNIIKYTKLPPKAPPPPATPASTPSAEPPEEDDVPF